MKERCHQRSASSLRVINRLNVSFWPCEEIYTPEAAKQIDLPKQTRHLAKGHFTPNPGKSWMSLLDGILWHTTRNFPFLGKLLNVFKHVFFQIKVTVTALHLSTSALPVHISPVCICLTVPTLSCILRDWLTLALTRQNGTPACHSNRKRKKRWEVYLFLLLCQTHEKFFFFLWSYQLFHNLPTRVVTGIPWRCFSASWTNTGQGRGRCIKTTTSCVSWSLFFGGCHIWFQESEMINVFSSFLLMALAEAVQILSMMEEDISSRESKVRTLRWEAAVLSLQVAVQEEEHKTKVLNLSAQLVEARSAILSGCCTWKQSLDFHSFTKLANYDLRSNTGPTKWAASDRLARECVSPEAAYQVRTTVSQVPHWRFPCCSDKRWV